MENTIYINKKSNELYNLYKLSNAIKYDIQNTELPINGLEEMELDELYFELEKITEKIININTFLHVINQTNKFKPELLGKKIYLV